MYKLRKIHMLVNLDISECFTMNTDYVAGESFALTRAISTLTVYPAGYR